MNRTIIKTTLAGALLLGGAGAALIPSIVAAADPTASPTPAATAPAGAPSHDGQRGPGGPFGHVETVSDMKVAADAIGISETDLVAQLQAGKSLADVAKAKNVDPQKVIDALVADEKAEIAAAVTAGTETQAQADQELANLTQRITDRVNQAGMGPGGKGGHDGQRGPGGAPNQAPATAPTTTAG